MSYKETVVKFNDNRYVFPKLKEMKCDVEVFLNDKLFNETNEELWADVYTAASLPGVKQMYCLPDLHKAGILPVGSAVYTDETIILAGSGHDICCGVLCLELVNPDFEKLASKENRRKWMDLLSERINFGVGNYRPGKAKSILSVKNLGEVFRYGAKALKVDSSLCEETHTEVDPVFDEDLIESAITKAFPQFGSVGGGNHFQELSVSPSTQKAYIMIHCGSRGYGYQTAEYFFNKAAEELGIPNNRRYEATVKADTLLGKKYWAYHNSAANYARANRIAIAEHTIQVTQEVFGCDCKLFYDISHNLVQKEGSYYVHRKGSTRSFPSDHASLSKTVWSNSGHPILIPGSMYNGAAILYPLNSEVSGFTVNHGSGRKLPRGAARRELTILQDDIDKEMNDTVVVVNSVEIEGILTNTRLTSIEECRHVYKDLDEVLDVVTKNQIAIIRDRMYPIANLKGADGGQRRGK